LTFTRADEHLHPGAGGDRWWFDLTAPVARLTVELVAPAAGPWHYRAVLRDGGRPGDLVVVDDDEVPPPRGRSLEVRTHGLWAEQVVEEPFDHVSVGCEAFALRLEPLGDGAQGLERLPGDGDPAAPLVGEPVPFGLDLGWEAEGGPTAVAPGPGYRVEGVVYGEILLGDARIVVERAHGGWGHVWGRDLSMRSF
jgi:hypothetical protein